MKKKIVYSEPDCGGIQPKPLTVKAKYVEPADYIPEDLRKKYKLGEYAESKELIMIKSVIKMVLLITKKFLSSKV